jgi:hypothetical protein
VIVINWLLKKPAPALESFGVPRLVMKIICETKIQPGLVPMRFAHASLKILLSDSTLGSSIILPRLNAISHSEGSRQRLVGNKFLSPDENAHGSKRYETEQDRVL